MTAKLPPRYAAACEIEELGEIKLTDVSMGLWTKDEEGRLYAEFKTRDKTAYALCQLSLEDLRPLAERFSKAAEIADSALGE